MVTLKIVGMSCGHCVMHVKQALAAVPGAGPVEVDLGTGEATIQGSAHIDELISAVEAEGYTALKL